MSGGNMKKLIILILLLCIPSVSFAEKDDIGEFDGNSWLSWSALEKISFLRGFLSASGYIVSANSGGIFYCSITNSEYNAEKAQNVWSIFHDTEKKKKINFSRGDVCLLLDSQILSKNESSYKFGIYGITVGQLYEGLNLFFNDFKNKQIKLSLAIHVVKKQIEGASGEEIEALTQWLRGGGKDFSKRFYIDKEGKKMFISFP